MFPQTIGKVSVLFFLAAAAISGNAYAAPLEEVLGILKNDGFSIAQAKEDKNVYFVTWRNSGSKNWAAVELLEQRNNLTEISVITIIKSARDTMSPRLVNQINAETKFAKLYIDDDGDGIVERYELFLEDRDNAAIVAGRIFTVLDEIESIQKNSMSSSTAADQDFEKANRLFGAK